VSGIVIAAIACAEVGTFAIGAAITVLTGRSAVHSGPANSSSDFSAPKSPSASAAYQGRHRDVMVNDQRCSCPTSSKRRDRTRDPVSSNVRATPAEY
jgi:hypothetical protein